MHWRVESALAISPFTGEYITMLQRNIESAIRSAMADTPVVLLNGARQTGKTTLAHAIAEKTGAQYFTLDDSATLALASGDPSGFIRNLLEALTKFSPVYDIVSNPVPVSIAITAQPTN
jgi:predicted AAA+ superfamily ATPase